MTKTTSRSGNRKGVSSPTSVKPSPSSVRIERVEFYRDLVFSLARRSTCNRAQVGAIIVNRTATFHPNKLAYHNRVVGMGYNGAPSGSPHCLDVGCLKYQGRCLRTVHAEMNALVEALKNGLEINAENELWCTHRPCFECSRMLHKAGVFKVRYWIEYKDPRAKFINPDMNFTRIGGISES